MQSYSQSKEDLFIAEYFGDYIGTLLSIGENDGITLSNSLLLIANKWKAVLVEPSPEAFDRLLDLHENNESVYCINVAVSDYNGKGILHHSGSHLGNGDVSLLSSLQKKETERWHKEKFEEIKVPVVTFEKLLSYSPYKDFDFLSIDCEGEELIILKQIDFNELKTGCVCVEYNSKDEHLYNEVMFPFGFKLIHKNAENLIYFK